jgi:hypothetical protein
MNTFSYALNNPTELIDSNGLRVVIIGHLAGGLVGRMTNPNSYHMAIYLEPDDKCGCEGKWPMTIGGQPDFHKDGTTWLVKKFNYPGDAMSQSTYRQVVPTPSGMTDCGFIKKLMAVAGQYGDDQRYSPPIIIPGFGRDGQMPAGNYNSNSFVAGVFAAAGVAVPSINSANFQTPGYSNPVPMHK